MNEWNLNQRETRDEKDEFRPGSKPGSRRISFCPTCGRPFVRGTGVIAGPGVTPPVDPLLKEYCRQECLPGLLA